MVTVIADQEELTTPVHNGGNTDPNDPDRTFSYIKDYQEVDFHRSPSCKPLPDDLFGTAEDPQMRSSIKGIFFVQVDGIEPIHHFRSHAHPHQPVPSHNCLLLTLTDGVTSVQGITNDEIPNLSFNVRPGCKLLITGAILVKDGLLQLTHDNTRFQYGSSTYPRPRSAYRGRGGGSHRPSYEGRRGGGSSNGNARYDHELSGGGESSFLKRPPPKSTLMDYMTSFKISHETKPVSNDETEKSKDRPETKRRTDDQFHPTNKTQHDASPMNSFTTPHSNPNGSDQIVFQQGGISDSFDSEDDPSQSGYRERRNPLPPRLQRAQEERSRRNTNRYYDETATLTAGDINGDYQNGSTSNPLLSSPSSYLRAVDQNTFVPNHSSSNPQHMASLHAYAAQPGMLSAINSSGQPHLAYFTTSPGPLAYNLANIPNVPYHSQPPPMGLSYPNEHLTFCYGPPYAPVPYLPPSMANGYGSELKSYGPNANLPVTATVYAADENETTVINESQVDETIDSENKSQSSSIEPKAAITSSSSSSSNDGHSHSRKTIEEQPVMKRRDPSSNPRPRWKINDVCLARWSEDREFYVATIVQIQPPFCLVIFRDYQNYDQVHFSDLRIIPREQHYYPVVVPATLPSSDLNPLAPSAYFPPRPEYYPTTVDGCIIMPEAPPFPFNSAGTLFMCPPPFAVIAQSTPRSSASSEQSHQSTENGCANAHPTVDSNDTSRTDSTVTSTDETQQQREDASLSTDEVSSNLAAPPPLVTAGDEQNEENKSVVAVL